MLGVKHGGGMSINDYADSLEDAARMALMQAGAIEVCPFHSDVTIRVGDESNDRHAYALAQSILNRNDEAWMREDLMPAIKDELDQAADGVCPQCEYLRHA